MIISFRLDALHRYTSTLQTVILKIKQGLLTSEATKLLLSEQVEGILITTASLLQRIRAEKVDISKTEELKFLTVKRILKVIRLLTLSIQPLSIPFKQTFRLVKVVYFDFDHFLDFLKNLFQCYKDEMSDYDETDIKKLVIVMLKYLSYAIKFGYSHEAIRSQVDNHIQPIFEICFSFLMFRGFDFEKMRQNPMDFKLNIEDIIGDCVSENNLIT